MNAKSVLVVVSMGALACASASATNVLVNPGFEDGLTSWSGGGAIRGGDPTPHGGLAYLFGGAVSSFYTYQMLTPATMGVSEADIDAGLVEIDFGGWQAGWGTQRDEGKIEIKFLDQASATLATMDLGWFHSNHTWTERSGVTVAPAGTRFVEFGFYGLRHDGSNCDAYLDDAFVIPQILPSGSTLAMFALAIGAARRRR
ncbi:MAG: hypothetical protein IT434_12435 [Phycisphaerales bacterium]|jgi:hypothetical protein|nr:hypothetical protein [Phycisphaerales bacterium]